MLSVSILIPKVCDIEMMEAADKNIRRVTAHISTYGGRLMNMMISGRHKRIPRKLLKLKIITQK